MIIAIYAAEITLNLLRLEKYMKLIITLSIIFLSSNSFAKKKCISWSCLLSQPTRTELDKWALEIDLPYEGEQLIEIRLDRKERPCQLQEGRLPVIFSLGYYFAGSDRTVFLEESLTSRKPSDPFKCRPMVISFKVDHYKNHDPVKVTLPTVYKDWKVETQITPLR